MMSGLMKTASMVLPLQLRQLLSPTSAAMCVYQKRGIKKHWDPKFRHLRAKKWLKVELPDYDEIRREANLTPEEIRSKLKAKGVVPIRQWEEKPIFLSSTGEIIEPFVPPEGDGKVSILTKAGALQRMSVLTKKGKSYMAVRKIRSYEDDIDLPKVAEEVQDIFIAANEALAKKDEDLLHELVTEKCFPEMMMNVHRKTISWKFIKSLEPPCIVQVRNADLITKENLFAQVTLRMHSQQTLAVYDRFGRLMYGGENIIKDVLEYIVFEKHLADTYGKWRVHGKIIPSWMPPKDTVKRTFVKKKTDVQAVPEAQVVPSPSVKDASATPIQA